MTQSNDNAQPLSGTPLSAGTRRFALIGAAGYIAPRHMAAIRETGNVLAAALDPNDSVGIIDSYFPQANFFTEFERFDRFMDKCRRRSEGIEYVSICSPNYLHDAHIRHALRSGAEAICEKPIVLNPWNLDALQEIERETGRKVNNILQLRLHPAIRTLRESIQASRSRSHDIDVTYITSRGQWYHNSWKGDLSKSGGIATNIGVHFFDMLHWIFGPLQKSVVHLNRDDCAAGYLQLGAGTVRWFLSINAKHLPEKQKSGGNRTFRSITVDGQEIEFSDGFGSLHTDSYREILAGRGFDAEAARPSIETVHTIRNATEASLLNDFHPYCTKIRSDHA